MTAAWAVEMSAGDKLVLLALADCANDEGHCWPGVKSLCRKTGKSERSLQAALASLEKNGQITRQQVPGKGCNYTVHPRNNCAPAKSAPPQKSTQTPAEIAGKPSRTVSSDKANALSPRAKGRPRFAVPVGVTPEQWQPFVDQRKKPLNERAYTLLCNKLRDFAEDGFPPGEMIDLATERGWETVFKPREQRNDRQQQPASRNTTGYELAMRGVDPAAPF